LISVGRTDSTFCSEGVCRGKSFMFLTTSCFRICFVWTVQPGEGYQSFPGYQCYRTVVCSLYIIPFSLWRFVVWAEPLLHTKESKVSFVPSKFSVVMFHVTSFLKFAFSWSRLSLKKSGWYNKNSQWSHKRISKIGLQSLSAKLCHCRKQYTPFCIGHHEQTIGLSGNFQGEGVGG